MQTVIIIGGGIIGCFIAHDLSKYEGIEVLLLEKHGALCEEVSAANSAIIHAGYDPEEGTLKGKLNKRGADLYPDICKRLGVDYLACGALVVATNEEELATIDVLAKRAEHRGIKVEKLSKEQVLALEGNVQPSVCGGMSVPSTAVVTPWEIGTALLQEAMLNGVRCELDSEVTSIHKTTNGYEVQTNKEHYHGDVIINAAGLGATSIMKMIEDVPLFTMTPKRGQYYILSKHAFGYSKQILYPVPSSVGKGVLCIPTVHGNTLIGPNSEVSDLDTSTTAEGLAQVKEQIHKMMKDVPFQEVIHSYSGIRPCGNENDFYIKASPKDPHVIHLGCIDSPGLASAPAISEYVLQTLLEPLVPLVEKQHYEARSIPVRMKDLDESQKAAFIQQVPAYGHIICRCEQISEQEVVNCIHEQNGAHTIKEIKKRLRPGMGKCQGGYCEIEVAKLLARELNIPLHEVRYDETAYYQVSKGALK